MNIFPLLRLMRIENERLMKLGHAHMNEDEMRFIISGVYGRKGEAELTSIVERIKANQ